MNKKLYRYGRDSQNALKTCHPDLVRVFTKVLEEYDHKALCGGRNQAEQDELFRQGRTQVRVSEHQAVPSNAVDVAPFPVDWGETGTSEQRQDALHRFYHFAGFVRATAVALGVDLVWGGDWDGDKLFGDQSFDDLVHWQRAQT